MKYLFRKAISDAVEDKYGDDRIYEALRIPCIAQMNESEEFALHPSDLFYHTLFTIDEMKTWSAASVKKYISNALWDDLYSFFRENSGVCSKDDLNRAAAEVMYSVAMLLTWSDNPAYIPLAGTIIYQIEKHLPGYTAEVRKKFDDSFDMQDADAFRKYLADYLVSDEQISDKIDMMIDEIGLHDKAPVVETPVKEVESKAGSLTIGQLVILFSSVLNVGLDPVFDNQSSLATFIARVSGKEFESIRQKIMSLAKARKPTKQTKKDAEIVAKMLDTYNPKLAGEIRDRYIDD